MAITPILPSFTSAIIKETDADFGLKKYIEPVELTQYDDSEDGSLVCIKANLKMNGATYYAPDNVAVKIRFGTYGAFFAYYDALGFLVDRSTVILPVRLQMTVMYGDFYPTVEFVTADGSTVASAPIHVHVNKSTIQYEFINNFIKISSFKELDELIDIAKRFPVLAEAWAIGTKDGVPVSPSDAMYQNHSKWYSEIAKLNAEEWATGTRNGVPVSEDAETYHNNSKWYASESKKYKNNCAESSNEAYEYKLISEEWALGTREGVPVAPATVYHKNNAKWYAEAAKLDSEEWATGTRNGEPVDEDRETYHNNSKWYSEVAKLDSEAWARGTKNGASVYTDDETYQNNSKWYAEVARQCLKDLEKLNVSTIFSKINGIMFFLGIALGDYEAGIQTSDGYDIVLGVQSDQGTVEYKNLQMSRPY